MNEITLGDIIGYLLTFVVGLLTGVIGEKYVMKNKKVVNQNKNVVLGGDIVGGDKSDKKDQANVQ